MKHTLLILAAFAIGFTGVAAYGFFRTQTAQPPTVVTGTIPTLQPTFALTPPSEAVSGMLTQTTGHVLKLSRTDSDFKEASAGAVILTGESLATKDQSAATATVSGILTVSLGQNAEVAFANMYPSNFVLLQKSGQAEYRIFSPISVRALHTLIGLEPGNFTITIINTDLSVTVTSGSATIALVDTDNNTHIWNLSQGERANIDDATRQVYLIKAR